LSSDILKYFLQTGCHSLLVGRDSGYTETAQLCGNNPRGRCSLQDTADVSDVPHHVTTAQKMYTSTEMQYFPIKLFWLICSRVTAMAWIV